MAAFTQIFQKHDFLYPIRQWLESMEIHNPKLAHFLCKLIPSQCPFERDIIIFGRKLFHIPAMCKLNPLYEQVITLRFKALCYLADECGKGSISVFYKKRENQSV